MRLTDIKILAKPLVLAKPADVDRLESKYWITLPRGYREYVTRLGEGVLGGSLVRIYPPWRVSRELAEWRERIREYWFWDAGRKLLPKDRALECFILGDTLGGDELVFHPSKPDHLFVLPHESERIFEAGRDLLTAVEWMCSSGKLVDPFEERNFEPFDSRKVRRGSRGSSQPGVSDPEGHSFQDIVRAAERWAERHELLKRARREIKSPLEKLPRKQLQVADQRQLVVFVPGKYQDKGFYVEFNLIDKKTGLEVGTLYFLDRVDQAGSGFTPNRENWEKLKSLYGGTEFDKMQRMLEEGDSGDSTVD